MYHRGLPWQGHEGLGCPDAGLLRLPHRGIGVRRHVAALRLTEKGYRVAVLERGRRFPDEDFAKTTWNLRRYLWAPGARLPGGSCRSAPSATCSYCTALAWAAAAWVTPTCWCSPARTPSNPRPGTTGGVGQVLRPFYVEAQRMLGVTVNPFVGPADETLRKISADLGQGHTFHSVPVGTFFGKAGEEGEEVSDPYFGGAGPARRGCKLCGGCMVGCRHQRQEHLAENYLYFAEARAPRSSPTRWLRDIRPWRGTRSMGRATKIHRRGAGGWIHPTRPPLRARNVLVSAGALGTLRLLFRCRTPPGP